MKKLLLAVIITAVCATCSYALSDKGYATSGVIELSGSASLSGTRVFQGNSSNDDYGTLLFSIRPMVDFFVINGFHLGLGPGFQLDSDIYDDGTINEISIGPVFSPGYCFRFSDRYFLDLSPAFGFYFNTYTDSGDQDASLYADTMHMSFAMNVTFKIAVGHALINVGLYEQFNYYTWDDPNGRDYLTTGVSLGFSVYF